MTGSKLYAENPFGQDSAVRSIRLKIADLFALEGNRPAEIPSVGELTALVLDRFGFLPKPIMVHVEGDEIVIQHPEESYAARAEAARLAERASKRAEQGDYQKAIGILKRVLELQPSFHAARRDLAMVYVEVGDIDNATNHLIEVLRLDPENAWGWLALGNLYLKQKQDMETGERFLRKALKLAPNNAWALNSLAAVHRERGEGKKALDLFARAIEANPELANAYYGQALIHEDSGDPQSAVETLQQMFTRAKMQDVRSKPVFNASRQLFAKLEADIAERTQSEAFKTVQVYKSEMESLSGFRVRIQEATFENKMVATIQMAWKHQRDYHLVKVRSDYPPPLVCHLEAHELTHLKLESEARKEGKNLFFATTPTTREAAIRALAVDVRKWQKAGYAEEKIIEVTLSLVGGVCGLLFNCPLDMVIERYIRGTFATLRPAQFLSVRKLALEAWQATSDPESRRLTPRKVFLASTALNGAYALFLDDLFRNASDFASPYRNVDNFAMAERLWKHWQSRATSLGPGEEYRLVDEFADMLGLRDWYEWHPDLGGHDAKAEPLKEGTTNPELLSQKSPAAVFYFLDAFKRFDDMTPEQVRDVAFEIALLGQSGLDYASADEKYELRSLPGRKFSGLHLMCLMYAGFKRVAPEHDLGLDLNDPFLTALAMHGR
jgi:tetratricopeptide (TPR) repeat protein